jgi:UDP-N-acetylglucosamine--dolichyl-phosphate N-acetylglucosaminephosphotransferase
MVIAPFFVALIVSFFAVPVLITRLKRAGISGNDIHKTDHPEVSEMGGLAIVIGFGAGILLTVAMVSFFHVFPSVDLIVLLAVLSTVLLAGLIGMVDDLLGMRQWIKALLPVFAALPLMAVRAGHAWIRIPYVGTLNFWIFYPLLVVPAGITIAANAVNMLAGFNGLETGLGIVAIGSLAILAAVLGETTALILLLSGLGALLGIIYYNWYPARILVGDIGTLSIGAIIATAVIVGNFETAGVIVIIPYAVDFLFKAAHGFPSSGWGGELRDDGKLHCPVGSPVGVGQFIMKITGGIKEQTLTLALMGIELIFGVLAIAVYL